MPTTNQTADLNYNRVNFPTFVCNHGNWDIYASATGHCAAIPSEAGQVAGCRASGFGDMAYTRMVLREEIAQEEAKRSAERQEAATV